MSDRVQPSGDRDTLRQTVRAGLSALGLTCISMALPAVAAPAQDLTTVRIGDGPYIEFATFRAAHELGLDEEVGLSFEFSVFPQIPAAQLVRGDIDIAFSSPTGGMAFYEQVPGYQDFMIHNVFQGFSIVARPGSMTPYAQYAEGAEDLEAAKQAFIEGEMVGRSLCLYDAAYRGLVQGVMAQANRSVDDLEIIAFTDDVTGANAFLARQCDMYIGALPQVVRMLADFPEEAEVVAPQQMFGPGEDGILFYETYAAEASWLADNPDTAVRLWAVLLRLVEYLKADPEGTSALLANHVRETTGVQLSDAAVERAFTEQLLFLGVDDLEAYAFDPESARYYATIAQVLGQQTKDVGQLPEDIDVADHHVVQEIWDLLQDDDNLLAWIRSPIE